LAWVVGGAGALADANNITVTKVIIYAIVNMNQVINKNDCF